MLQQYLTQDDEGSLAEVTGLLAQLYIKQKSESQVSSSSFIPSSNDIDTGINTIKQNIASTLSKEPMEIGSYFVFYEPDTGNIPDEQLTTIKYPKNVSDYLYNIDIDYRNPEEVLNFLRLYPDINKLISKCWPDLVYFFGENVSITLELMAHNENEHYEELIGWIQSTDSIDEGLDKFDLFMDKWIDIQLEIAGTKFNFNIEFK